MTTEILKNEMMSEEQLEQVAGGTCQETDEIIEAIGEVRFIGSAPHKLERGGVEAHLSIVYGIVAETHNGFLFFSDGAPNTYERVFTNV